MGDFKINEKTVFTQSGGGEPAMGSTITDIPAAGVTGVLPVGVTGGTGLSGGIKNASTWRLTANPSTGQDIELPGAGSAIWEEADTTGAGSIGSAMTVATNIFTFPATGVWYIGFKFFAAANGGSRTSANCSINVTLDNSSYAVASLVNFAAFANNAYCGGNTDFIFDVTNVSTHKCKFAFYTTQGNFDIIGSTSYNATSVTFIRLGDAS